MKRVFLSSTGKDLLFCRQAAYEAIEGLDGYHCVRMEDFGARNFSAVEFDREKIKKCDLFVVIVGHLYGSIPPRSEASFTELEYQNAVELNKPRLVFLASDNFQIPINLIEPDAKRAKQRVFREKLTKERIVDYFMSPNDISVRIVKALVNLEREASDARRVENLLNSKYAHIPLSPKPYYAHPYPLQEHFTGRLYERQILNEWLLENEQPILTLVAIGGMGKSALTWIWLQHDVLQRPIPGLKSENFMKVQGTDVREVIPFDGIIWWSFYESESSFSVFTDEAIIYISRGEIFPGRFASSYDKVRVLTGLLQQYRILIIFDGFERNLCAYGGLNSAYQEDEKLYEGSESPRSCINPIVSKFLEWMAGSSSKSFILLTSRLYPRELESFEGIPLAGCKRMDLQSMDPEDAFVFFKNVGIKGTRQEIGAICKPYGYHTLSIRLLAGYIMNNISQSGEPSAASNFNPVTNLVSRQHHILELAYQGMQPFNRQLLSRIAAFRSPIEFRALKAISEVQDDNQLENSIKEMIDRGLVFFDRERQRLDLHPIVRQFAYSQLVDKGQIHACLRDYFSAFLPGKPVKIQSIEEMVPVLELYHHTLAAGYLNEANRIYEDRLNAPLWYFGLYQTGIELLNTFFKVEKETKSGEKIESRDGLVDQLACYYGFVGQPREAVNIYRKYIDSLAVNELNKIGGLHFSNMGYFLINLGRLSEATQILQKSMQIGEKSGDRRLPGYGHLRLGLIQSYIGCFEEARTELNAALLIFNEMGGGGVVHKCHIWNYRSIRALLMKDLNLSVICAREALKQAKQVNYERMIIRGQYMLGRCLLIRAKNVKYLKGEDILQVESMLIDSLSRCHRINLIEFEADILLTWAYWHRLRGNITQAKDAALKAFDIAARCEYRLTQAEIHFFLAELYLGIGEKDLAKQHAEAARDLAFCDGEPYCYKTVLEQARTFLEQFD